MHNHLKHLLVISLLCFLSCSSLNRTEHAVNNDSKMMEACERYISEYTPLYIVGGEIVLVARFNVVPDSINNYLINCARLNDFKPLKYSAALIIRQHKEFLMKNNQEYMLMDALVQRNGFIVLLRQAMKIGKVDDDFTSMDYFPVFSGEACKWINDNKAMISDYKFVEKQKKKR